MHLPRLFVAATAALIAVEAATAIAGGQGSQTTQTVSLSVGDSVVVECSGGVLQAALAQSPFTATCGPTQTTATTTPISAATTTTTGVTTTTAAPTTTVAPTTTGAPTTAAPSVPTTTGSVEVGSPGTCTNPVWSTSDLHGTDNLDPSPLPEYWWMDNDGWNGGAGPQTLYVCNQQSWYAVSDQTNQGGAVETYPNSEYDVGGRGNEATAPALSSYHSITSTFSENFPSTGSWDAAYDLWTNNWGTETMIWNADLGTQTFWNTQGTAVTIGGVAYQFINNGGEYIFIMQNQESSGSVNILAVYQYEIANGLAKASDKLTQMEYGAEICATSGTETFPLTGLTFNVS